MVADASQLEPRILAAMSGDARMAEAGREKDMYAGIVASGAVATRAEAKVAMLGAMYGATTGESGRLMPKLTRAYPKAIGLVEDAARAGRARRDRDDAARPQLAASGGRVAGWRSPRRTARRRRMPTGAGPAPRRAPGAGSPATSSCRAPPPSGRCAGWRSLRGLLRRSAAAPG